MVRTEVLCIIGAIFLCLISLANAMKCNGMEGLCRLPFNKVTFPGSHNSASYKTLYYGNGLPALNCFYRNQDIDITRQLNFGIRFLDIDTCLSKTEIYTCHNTAYGDKLSKILEQVANWLNKPENRNEVVAARFHDTNFKGFTHFKPLFEKYFPDDPNKGHLATSYSKTNSWPTMADTIAKNERFFVFMVPKLCDSLCTAQGNIQLSWYMSTWTEFTVTAFGDCKRTISAAKEKCAAEGKTYMLNIVSVPATKGLCNKELADKCNWFAKDATQACKDALPSSKTVNFILVDYVNKNTNYDNVVEVARKSNEENIKAFSK